MARSAQFSQAPSSWVNGISVFRLMKTLGKNSGCLRPHPAFTMSWRCPKPEECRFRETSTPLCRTFRSEEHTSELQSLMRISYAVFCLKKNTNKSHYITDPYT